MISYKTLKLRITTFNTLLKTILGIFLLLVSLNLHAQNNLRYGIKAGYHRAGFNDGNSSNLDNNSFHFGGIVEMEQNDFFALKGELLFDRKAGFLNFRQNNRGTSIDTRLDYVSLPFFGKITLIKNLSLEGGPQFAYLFKEKGTYVSDGSRFQLPETNPFEVSVGGGLSYKFISHALFQIRYSTGISKVFKELDYTNTALSFSL